MDGLHLTKDMMTVEAAGINADGNKHVFGFDKGARENAAIVQAMLDNLTERRPPPDKTHLFILNGAKALSQAMQNTFGGTAEIQRRLGCDSEGTCRSDFA